MWPERQSGEMDIAEIVDFLNVELNPKLMMDVETARQIRKQLLRALKNPPFNDPKGPQRCSYGRKQWCPT